MSDAPAPGRLPTDPDDRFTGTEIRRLTAKAAAAHADAGHGQVFSDIAYVATTIVIAIGLVIGIANQLRDALAPGAAGSGGADLAPGWVRVLVCAALFAGALGLALRFGPAGVSGAGVRWWLPMPVDRAGLITPSFRRALYIWPPALAAADALVWAVTGASALEIGTGAALGAAGGLALIGLAGVVQPRARLASLVAAVADGALAVVPAVGLVAVHTLSGEPGELPWWPIAVVAAGGVVLVVWWRLGLGRLGQQVLGAVAGSTMRAQGALLSMDTRELGRALQSPRRSRRRRHRSRSWGAVRGPVSALATADAALLARSPAELTQLIGLVFLLLLGVTVPMLSSGFGLFALLVIVGFRAGQLGALGARVAQMAPTLDGLLPLSARHTRMARSIVPMACGALVLGLGTIPLVGQFGPGWPALALAAGATGGLAAIRSAYREAPDWSGPLMATPAGALPTGAAAVFAKGPDAAVLGSVPLGIAVFVETASPVLVAAQLAVCAIVLAVATKVRRVGSKSGFADLMEKAAEQAKERR